MPQEKILRQVRAKRAGAADIQLYASSPADPRTRRPVDALRAVCCLLVLLLAALLSAIGGDIDRGISEVLTSFPGFLKTLWLAGLWLATGWSLALLVIAVYRHRLPLALEGVAAIVLALAIVLAVAAIVSGDTGDVLRRLADSDGPPVFPPATLAMTSAVLAVMAPYLSVPSRRFGRALIAAQLIGSLFLGVSQVLGAFASLTIGLFAGAVCHLWRGSPGGFPTVTRVLAALDDVGVTVDQLVPTSMRPEGVAVLTGTDAQGDLEVRVYGRDAWEGALLADMWRRAWYRGTRRTARMSRSEYVEHEGFMTFLAERGGVDVPSIVTAGLADNGDALIVVRPNGTRLDADHYQLSLEHVRTLWANLARLHSSGIAHHRIDLDRVVLGRGVSAGFNDLSSASPLSDLTDATNDRAQLFALSVVTSGKEVAAESARAAIGHDGVAAMIPYLQEAALPPLVRSGLRRQHVDLDAIRKELAGSVGAEEAELAKVRRVTWKSLLNLALLAVAAYTIIGMLSGLDRRSLWRDLKDADLWWLLATLLIGQTPRFANALSTLGSTQRDLPYGPTTALQFATCYVNLAVPSSAGRIAITTRFLQRFGIAPATALSAGIIDSLSEFVVQVILFLSIFFISDIDLQLSMDTSQLSGLATTVLIVVAVLVVAAVVALLIPSVRQRVATWFGQARDAMQVLRSPRKLAQLFGGNLLSQVLFAITIGACARAFGFDIPLSSLILINTVVGLFAGLLPIPGDIGVSEAGLALGLTRVGVPSETAFAIALTYRFCTFYLPPIWGFASYRWLTARRYL